MPRYGSTALMISIEDSTRDDSLCSISHGRMTTQYYTVLSTYIQYKPAYVIVAPLRARTAICVSRLGKERPFSELHLCVKSTQPRRLSSLPSAHPAAGDGHTRTHMHATCLYSPLAV